MPLRFEMSYVLFLAYSDANELKTVELFLTKINSFLMPKLDS